MTDFLSRLREAIERRATKGIDMAGEALIIAAARCVSEGEPLLWCKTHSSQVTDRNPDKYTMCVWLETENRWDMSPEPDPCSIVSQWRCPPPEGES